MSVSRYLPLARGILLGAALAMTSSAALAQKREFSFAYDQPKNSGYGIGAEMFNKKLGELSGTTLLSSLGLDSVQTMEVIGAMEERLNVQFPDEDLATLKSIGDLTRLVQRLAA